MPLTTQARIIAAALLVAADEGIGAVTHRRISAIANVSLGSINYHFSGIEDVILKSFETYIDREVGRYHYAFTTAETPEQLRDAIMNSLLHRNLTSRADIALMYELYAQAARRPEYRTIVRRWMAGTRESLVKICGKDGSIRVEAGLEGLILQRFLGRESLSNKNTEKFILDLILLNSVDREAGKGKATLKLQ